MEHKKTNKTLKNIRTKLYSITTETNGFLTIETVENAIKPICEYYFIIEHDKDVKEETGEIRDNHIHIVLKLKTRTYATALLKILSEHFNINKNAISIQETISEAHSVQYLTHQNYQDKHQYAPFLIKTNRPDILESYLNNTETEVLTAEKLLLIVEQCNNNKIKILQKLGLNQYQKYSRIVDMIVYENEKYDFEKKSIEKIRDYKESSEYYINKKIESLEHKMKKSEKAINEKAIELLNIKKSRK